MEKSNPGKEGGRTRGLFKFEMKIISWNVRGLGGALRRMVVKEMIRRQKVQITLIQETKLKEVNEKIVKEILGTRFIGWVAVESVGWDSRSVKILKSWRDGFSVSVAVEDLSNK